MADLKDMFGGGVRDRLLGLPAPRPGDPAPHIAVLGADCATPYPSVGAYCAGGPMAMRAGAAPYSEGFAKFNFDLGHDVLPDGVRAVDMGDLPVDPADPAGNRALIASTVAGLVAQGTVPMLLGGDDSLPTPMLQGLAALGRVDILQIDAHIDWRDSVEGESLGLSSTMRRASEMAHVGRIVQVGARGIGSASRVEVDAARAHGAVLVPAATFHAEGLASVLPHLSGDAPLVVCFDCDALDPSVMPAVIAPTGGGLTHAQVLALLRAAAARAPIAAFALVEFMPEADRDGIGARTAGQLLASVLGLIGGQCAARLT